MIVEKESVNISQNGIDKLIEGKNQFIQKLWFFILTLVAGGDMRRAITYLQSLHRLNPDEMVPTLSRKADGTDLPDEINNVRYSCMDWNKNGDGKFQLHL